MPEITPEPVQVSVIVTVYRNGESLDELRQRLNRALTAAGYSYEVLFVNDSCPAGSEHVLQLLVQEDPHLGVLSLAENVGQHHAVLLGMAHAAGDWLICMDGDLQDPPEAVPVLLQALQAGTEIVFAGRRGEYEDSGRLFTSRLFKTGLHWVAKVPRDAGMFFAVHRHVSRQLLTMNFPRPFVVAMLGCTGAVIQSIPVARASRPRGASAYSSWKRLKTGLLAILAVLAWKAQQEWPLFKLPTSAFKYPVIQKYGSRFQGAGSHE